MATITFKRGEEYMLKLTRLEKEAVEKVCGPAIHDGAKVVADAIRAELQNVPTDEGWGHRLLLYHMRQRIRNRINHFFINRISISDDTCITHDSIRTIPHE